MAKKKKKKRRRYVAPPEKLEQSEISVVTQSVEQKTRRFISRFRPPEEWGRLTKLYLPFGAAWVHLFIVGIIGAVTGIPELAELMLFMPFFICLSIASTRRKSWRWLILALLAVNSIPPSGSVVLLIGGAWIWHRIWFIDAPDYKRRKAAGEIDPIELPKWLQRTKQESQDDETVS